MAEAIERLLSLSINDQHVADIIIDLTDGLIKLSPSNVKVVMDQNSITFEDNIKIKLGHLKLNRFGNRLLWL